MGEVFVHLSSVKDPVEMKASKCRCKAQQVYQRAKWNHER